MRMLEGQSTDLNPAFYYVFKFILILWMALPQFGGAQVVFRSFLRPVLEPVFRNDQSASANLRAQAESVKDSVKNQ